MRDGLRRQLTALAGGVYRLVAPNAGMMTGPGTNSYLLGERERAIIDPGPAIPAHIDAIVEAAAGALRWILVTHTHVDHSPAAAVLARETGAEQIGLPAPRGEHQDPSFRPDRVPPDGGVLEMPEFALEALHTPGHASNHVCYRHRQLRWLFTGDHILDGSTVVIDPPDGNMADYLQSLRRLKGIEMAAIAPGHGNVIGKPYEAIDWIVEHRLSREAEVVRALAAYPGSMPHELVRHVYADVDPALHGVAGRSLLAHLEKLASDARAARRGKRWYPS